MKLSLFKGRNSINVLTEFQDFSCVIFSVVELTSSLIVQHSHGFIYTKINDWCCSGYGQLACLCKKVTFSHKNCKLFEQINKHQHIKRVSATRSQLFIQKYHRNIEITRAIYVSSDHKPRTHINFEDTVIMLFKITRQQFQIFTFLDSFVTNQALRMQLHLRTYHCSTKREYAYFI